MPRLDGIGALRRLREAAPAARVIVLTSFGEDERLFTALRAGAAGYLLKDVEPRRARARDPDRARRRGAAVARRRGARGRGARRAGRGRPRAGRRADAARARGAVPDRARALEQADRARARRGGEDGQDPRLATCWPSSGSPTARRRRCTPSAKGWSARGPRPNSRWWRGRSAPSLRGMPTAIVTGASRGLGLALSRALAERGWRLVIDAREAGPLEAAAAQLPGATPSPATCPIRATAARSSRPRERDIDLLVNNASLLGPSPQPRARRLPARRARAGLPRQRARAAGADPARAAAPRRASSTSPPTPPSSPTRAGAATAPRRPRSSSSRAILAAEHPEPPHLRDRPRRHEHAHAPGGVPGRGHLRPLRPRGARARPARPDRGRPAERPLQRRRAAGGARVSVALAFELTRRATRRARRPPSATRCACSSRGAAARWCTTCSAACPPTCAPGDLLVVNTSATMPAALSARGDGWTVHLSTPLPRRRRAARDRWVVELRRCGARFRGGRAGERLDAARAAARPSCSPRTSRPAGCGSPRSTCPLPLDDYLAAHGRPIAYAHLAEPRPLEDLQTVFADEPGSAEMPSAGRPFSARVLDDLLRARRAGRAARAPHRRLARSSAASARTPSATASPPLTASARQRPPRRRRPRDRGRHHRRARARDRRRARRHASRPARAGRA